MRVIAQPVMQTHHASYRFISQIVRIGIAILESVKSPMDVHIEGGLWSRGRHKQGTPAGNCYAASPAISCMPGWCGVLLVHAPSKVTIEYVHSHKICCPQHKCRALSSLSHQRLCPVWVEDPALQSGLADSSRANTQNLTSQGATSMVLQHWQTHSAFLKAQSPHASIPYPLQL